MEKPSPYRIFRTGEKGRSLVFQVRETATGEAVNPADLECYAAIQSISSPWGGIRKGSRLLLTPSGARYLLAAGTIEALPELETIWPPRVISPYKKNLPPDLGTGEAAHSGREVGTPTARRIGMVTSEEPSSGKPGGGFFVPGCRQWKNCFQPAFNLLPLFGVFLAHFGALWRTSEKNAFHL